MRKNKKLTKKIMMLIVFSLCGCLIVATQSPAAGQDDIITINTDTSRAINLVVNKMARIKSKKRIMRQHVTNPEIAELIHFTHKQKKEVVSTQSPNWVFLTGKSIGITQLTLWDENNNIIETFDIKVSPDIVGLKKTLHDLFPNEDIRVGMSADFITLSGTVGGSARLTEVVGLAENFAPGKIINMLQVGGIQQVMLEVRVAEMSRDVSRKLGVNFSASGGNALAFNMVGGLTDVSGGISENINAVLSFFGSDEVTNLFLEAMKEDGLVKILAEPTLIALSGQTASFLAGGEFPVPVYQDIDRITIEWKPFGVALNFTPTVLDDNKINMLVAPEVSEPDFSRTVSLSGFVVPSVETRRLSTVVELKDGQSFAVAGLLKNFVRENINRFPLLGDLPILGALFRSTEFERNESELVILVTPHLVKPLNVADQPLPTDSFIEPNEFELLLLGKLEGEPGPNVSATGQPSSKANGPGMEGDFGYIIPE